MRGLRRLYDDVESHIRSLKSLGVAPDSYDALLSPVLLNKLPPELRLIVSRKVPDSMLDVDSRRLWRKSYLLGNELKPQPRHRLIETKTNLALPQLHCSPAHHLPPPGQLAVIVSSLTLQPNAPLCLTSVHESRSSERVVVASTVSGRATSVATVDHQEGTKGVMIDTTPASVRDALLNGHLQLLIS